MSDNSNSLCVILEPLPVDKLKELLRYVHGKTIPTHQGELHPFFEWRAKQTLTAKNDTISITNSIIQVLNKKECEEKEEQPSPRAKDVIKGTQDTFSCNHDEDYYNNNNYQNEENRSNLNKNAPEYVPQLGTTLSYGNHNSLCSIAENLETPPLPSPSISPMTQPTSSVSSATTSITNPVISFPNNLNLDSMIQHNDQVMKQFQKDLATLPIPPGFSLAATPLSVPLSPVSSYSVSVPNANMASQQQSPSQLTQVTQPTVTSPIITPPAASVPNYLLHGANQFDYYTPAQQKQQRQQPQVCRQNYDDTRELKQEDEYRINEENNNRLNTLQYARKLPARQWTAAQSSPFKPKFNNHAKGNFYISKEMISKMINESNEEFITNNPNTPDEKLAFGHYKESVAMQINDEQVKEIQTSQGLIIIINIDLHFKLNGYTMYLIAAENAQEFRDRVRWCIVDFMSEKQIKHNYGLDRHELPKSSRSMSWYKKAMKRAPIHLKQRDIKKIVRETRFKTLPSKTSKRRQTGNEKINNNKSRISTNNLQYYVEQSLYNDNLPIHPVVVIKGKNQWIEWKRYVEIVDDNGYKQYVGISMRYYDSMRQWKIECMDYDAGRVFYQHRLASLPKNDRFNFGYNQLSRFITCTLDIYHSNRWH